MATEEATPATSEAIVVCTTPDVCLAPDKPVPYQISARFSDAENPSSNVRFRGYLATTMATRISRVEGDEEGTGGGITSGVQLGHCRPERGAAPNVRVNRELVLRHDTEFAMNCNGPEGDANTFGRAVFETQGPQASVDDGGRMVGDTNPPVSPANASERNFLQRMYEFDAERWMDERGQAYARGVLQGVGETVASAKESAQLAGDLLIGDLPEPLREAFPWLPETSAARGTAAFRDALGGVQVLMEDPRAVAGALLEPYANAYEEGGLAQLAGRGSVDAIGLLLGALGALAKLDKARKAMDKLGDLPQTGRALDVPEGSASSGAPEPGARVHHRSRPAKRYDPVTEAFLAENGLDPDSKLYRNMPEKYLDTETGTVAGNPRSIARVEDGYNQTPNPVFDTVAADYGEETTTALGIPRMRAPLVDASSLGPGLNASAVDSGIYGSAGWVRIEIRLGDALDAGGRIYRDVGGAGQGLGLYYVTFPGSIPYRLVPGGGG